VRVELPSSGTEDRQSALPYVYFEVFTSVTNLIRKIHIYAGLFTLSHLIIYGIAGLVPTFQHGPERPKTARAVRIVPFQVNGSHTDKQVADEVWRTLKLPLTRPMPDWFLRRTADKHLLLDFYNINGMYRVIVLEHQNQLRIEDIRNSTAHFLGDVHAATLGDREAPGLIRLWATWNELAMWALLGFCASGLYLWMATRPRLAFAWAVLVAGSAALAGLWRWFR
jgi:hypothetical protein